MAIKSLHNEQELLANVANRDQNAFRIVYNQYRPLVYSFSLKYLKSAEQNRQIREKQ